MFSYLPIIRFLAGRRRQCRFRKTKNNMIVAYLRVSTGKQNLANQQDEIRRFAESRELVITNWVTEVVSGKAKEKDRKLGRLLKRMKRGDTLIVTEISRLSRTLTDIMGNHGQMPQARNQPVHHQGEVLLRRHDQQQGALLRVRARGRNRAQPDLHAYPRGAGAASGRRHGPGTEKREATPNCRCSSKTGPP